VKSEELKVNSNFSLFTISSSLKKLVLLFNEQITIFDIRTILTVLLVFVLAIGIVYINKRIIYYINKLEDI